MAQSGYTPLSLYYSTTPTQQPAAGDLTNGELAINITDGKLYYKDNAGAVKLLASNGASTPVTTISFGSTGLTPNSATSGAISVAGTLGAGYGGTGQNTYAVGDLLIASGATTLSKLSIGANTYVLTSNGTTATWAAVPSSMVYPGAGIAVSTGSAWGTSLTAPSGAIVGTTDAQTLTNKRIDPRVSSTASSATAVTPDISAYDIYAWTAQAATLTLNAPTGTPVNGDKLIFRILDNGVSQTLSWDATYTAIGVTLPTATTAGKMTYVGCIYNTANTRWDVIAVTTQV